MQRPTLLAFTALIIGTGAVRAQGGLPAAITAPDRAVPTR
jgi:hypothetical protein